MKKTIFVRPNLKVFLLGAVLIIAVQHMVSDGHSQGSGLTRPLIVHARESVDPEVSRILSQSSQVPASHVYAQLSYFYEAQGDFRKALRYLRLANILAETEPDSD